MDLVDNSQVCWGLKDTNGQSDSSFWLVELVCLIVWCLLGVSGEDSQLGRGDNEKEWCSDV